MLLEELIQPEQRAGALVDGFPRTITQVKLLQMLHDKMAELSRAYDRTPQSQQFPRPRFRMCIMYVDEHESIQRQLSRGKQAMEHNRRVQEQGEGMLMEVGLPPYILLALPSPRGTRCTHARTHTRARTHTPLHLASSSLLFLSSPLIDECEVAHTISVVSLGARDRLVG